MIRLSTGMDGTVCCIMWEAQCELLWEAQCELSLLCSVFFCFVGTVVAC